MFESTLSAQGLSEGTRRLGPLSAAIFGHLAIVAVIVCVTALIVPPVPEQPEPHVLITVLRPPDLGFEPPGARQPKRGTEASRPDRSVAPQPPIEPPAPPVATPDPLPTPADAPAPEGPDGAGEGPKGLTDGRGTGFGENASGGGGEGGGGTGDQEAEPVFITADVVEPVLLVKVEPNYPDVARIARLSGRVIVKAVIGLDGSVESAEIFSSTSPLFNDTAKAAVLKWRYRPALMNGRPVRVYFTVRVEFSVR